MSISIMSWVWSNSTTKGSERLVLLALADNANDNGKCWPSLDTLAHKCNLSRRYVIDIISELEAGGHIKIETRRDGEKNLSNVYTIIVNPASLPSEPALTTHSEPEHTTLVNHSSPPGEPHLTRVVNPASPDPSIDPSLNPKRTSDEIVVDDDDGGGSPLFARMTTAFEQATGILMFNPPKWIAGIEQLVSQGIQPDDIKPLRENMPEYCKIAGPWSLAGNPAAIYLEGKKGARKKQAVPVEPRGYTGGKFAEYINQGGKDD